jgi:hypothetical protein
MVNYQTTTQKVSTIRFGSAKIEVGEAVASLVNLGTAQNVVFTESFTPIVLKPDNAPEITVGVREHYATAKFDLWEVDLSNLNLIRGGLDTYSTVAASPVTVTDELIKLDGVKMVRFANKSGDGSEPTSISVKDSSNSTAVRNTDYVIGVDAAGWPVIGRVAASTVITTGETVKVTYTYTPNASTKLSTGGLNTINPRVVRLTNSNSAGKKFQITIYAAKNQGGIELKLPGDDSEDPLAVHIELKGIVDPTRTAGDQLFEILDEQGA